MRKYLLFIYLIFVSCSQTYLEETQDAVSINTRVSYDTLDTGIHINWDTQWDFARVEILKGTEASELSVLEDDLAQNTWLDIENIPGKEYYYRIRAYNSKNRIIGQSDIHKGYRSYRSYDQIVRPSDLKTDFAKYTDKIEIYWLGDELDVFRVYRSTNADEALTMIAEVSFNSSEELKYSDFEVEQGKIYYYKVSSVGKKADNTVAEKMSEGLPLEGSAKIAPKGVKTTTKIGSIELAWDDDRISEYYQIYRSETEKEEDYELIVPFIKDEKYIDKNFPNIKGSYTDGIFSYPLYYYKIKAFAKGQESGFSDPATGYAIDPADYLSAPKNFTVAIDKSSFPYKLNFSWDAIGNDGIVYRLSKIGGDGVTNIILDNTTSSTHTTSNEEFNTQWEYIVQAINNNAGGLQGEASSKFYTSLTPAPPVVKTSTTNMRTFLTNLQDVEVVSRVYWKQNSWTIFDKPKYGNEDVGTTRLEWHVTSETGNIDITWDKRMAHEEISHYTVYRRRQGATKFEQMTNTEELVYSDTKFTPDEYRGSGTGDDFVYPFYEYQITATTGGQESAPSSLLVGSAINPNDILPAPEYVTIPAHWANGTGFNTYPAVIWQKGELSPKGAEKIVGKTGANHLNLVWGDVPGISTYRVRHSRGTGQLNWVNNSNYPIKGGNKYSVQWFNNNDTGSSMTGLYAYEDSIVWMYSKDSASFDVGPINGNAGYLLGDVRGIWFDEPHTKPSWYQ